MVVSRVSSSARLFICSWHMVLRPLEARSRSARADQDFLTLWKDADPDIPILIAANSG